jgi:hypothetical protein
MIGARAIGAARSARCDQPGGVIVRRWIHPWGGGSVISARIAVIIAGAAGPEKWM